MSQGYRIPLKPARNLAAKIIVRLRPYCRRIVAAGSIRRRRLQVGDIELLVIPRHQPSLLPGVDGYSLLDSALEQLVRAGQLLRANRGEVFQKFYIPHLYEQGQLFKLEVNISSPARWPVELAIKTGPAEFSQKLVTRRDMGGWLPSDCLISNGWQVRRVGGPVLDFESEREFIEFCCGRWIRPEDRGSEPR